MNDNFKDIAIYIANNANEKLALPQLAAMAKLSPFYFQRSFKAQFGLSPKDFQIMIRKKILKSELKKGENILDAIYGAGFGSTSRVYEASNNIGINLSKYRKKGAGENLYYAFAKTNKFNILMAASEKGVCAIEIGNDNENLLFRLQCEFPNAILLPSEKSNQLNHWLELLSQYVDNLKPLPQIPIDLRGTIFQEKIWRFLTSLKQKEIITYGEIAKKLNMPKAARAIGNAIGKNKIAILIPCHRVLRGDNNLGGYKWGIEKKKVLLENNL